MTEDFKIKNKYPVVMFCPVCGKDDVKENGEITFRCRECQTEFNLLITYDPKTDKNFWFDNKKQELIIDGELK